MNNEKVKRIILYVIKVAILFLLLFFTFVEPTALVVFFFVLPIGYIIVYAGLVVLLAEFPKPKETAKNFFMRHIFPFIMLCAGVAACFLMYFAGIKIGEIMLTARINNFAKKAEEIIPYDTSTYNMSGLLGTDFMHDVVMIDYDTKTVAFLYDGGNSEYKEFRLESGTVQDKSMLQLNAELNSPGESLTTYYYKDESYSHLTSSIMLTMEDGTVWSVSGLEKSDDDWLGLGVNTITLDERETDYYIKNRSFSEIHNGRIDRNED